jgi:hypothetical protein
VVHQHLLFLSRLSSEPILSAALVEMTLRLYVAITWMIEGTW